MLQSWNCAVPVEAKISNRPYDILLDLLPQVPCLFNVFSMTKLTKLHFFKLRFRRSKPLARHDLSGRLNFQGCLTPKIIAFRKQKEKDSEKAVKIKRCIKMLLRCYQIFKVWYGIRSALLPRLVTLCFTARVITLFLLHRTDRQMFLMGAALNKCCKCTGQNQRWGDTRIWSGDSHCRALFFAKHFRNVDTAQVCRLRSNSAVQLLWDYQVKQFQKSALAFHKLPGLCADFFLTLRTIHSIKRSHRKWHMRHIV